ncbi:MAG: DUF4340 domain-containing protein [Bacteroidota bacterium]|jgi:hypothetical protein
MKKNTYGLIGVFVVLLIFAFLVLQKPGEQSASSASRGFLTSIDSVSVDKIEIKTPTLSLVLEKRGTEWYIAQPINYKANETNVGQIIHQIKNLEVKSTVSSKPEKHSVFQVDQTGTEVKVYEKGIEKTSFVLGKMAASYTESYARKLNSNDVFLVEGAYSYMFSRSIKEWRDKTIFTTPKESIKEVQYQYGDTTFSMVFKDSIWLIGKDKVQQSVVDGVLSSLSNLQADDFIDSTLSPKIMASVMYAGVQIRFSFNKTTNKYIVQSSHSSQWFLLEPGKANQILKRKKEIVELSKK